MRGGCLRLTRAAACLPRVSPTSCCIDSRLGVNGGSLGFKQGSLCCCTCGIGCTAGCLRHGECRLQLFLLLRQLSKELGIQGRARLTHDQDPIH